MSGVICRPDVKAAITIVLGIWATALGANPSIGAETGPQFRPLVAAFHVHSTVSTGTLSLDELAEQAERRGLDAVILTDNFVLRYEYGLYPLRGVVRRTFSLPSVLDYGIDRYLADVAAAQARHPYVLLIPGIEVVPHYFWTGSLVGRDLTMHNSQKNILVFGLSRAEDYAALPVNGNPGSYRYGWDSILNLAPAILFVPAAWLWRRRIYRTTTVGKSQYRIPGRQRTSALVLAGAAIGLLAYAWPSGHPAFSPYNDRLGYQPYQAFINKVQQRGGVTIWSMPETRDFNVYPFGQLGNITIKTDPYPEALLMTNGYTGFGGVYQDTRTVTNPGDIWDLVLGQYLLRQRTAPPFAFGEIAFHTPGSAGIELDQVSTVFWVRNKTARDVIEAMREGRFYAAARRLRLDTFRVECAGGARGAMSGEALDPEEARDLTVRLSVTAADKGAHPISVTIIRSGTVISAVSGVTPFEQQFVDTTVPSGTVNFYRVAVQGDGEILSNPIFVAPIQAGPTPQPALPPS